MQQEVLSFLSLITSAAFVTFPLAYHNYIDVNLRYGYFKSVNEQDEIKITRHSCEYISYSGSNLLDGTWVVENDKLTMKFSNVEKHCAFIKIIIIIILLFN